MIELEIQAIELEERAKQSKNNREKCVLFENALQIREKLGHRRAAKFCRANLLLAQICCLLEKCEEKRESAEKVFKEVEKLCSNALPLFLELEIFELVVMVLVFYTKAYDLKCKEKGRYEYTPNFISILESGISKTQELKSEEELRTFRSYLWLMYNFYSKKSIFLVKQGTIDALRESVNSLEKAIEYAKVVAPHRMKTLNAYLVRRKIRVLKAENASSERIANLYLDAARLSEELGNEKIALEDYADYHKYMAYHHLDKGGITLFWDHIKKSIDYNHKAENPQGYHFAKGLFLREKGLRATPFRNKISLLREAKDEFFKSRAERSGRYLEFRVTIESAKHAKQNGRLQETIEQLSKAIRVARKLRYNVRPLICEISRIKAMIEIRRENYPQAYSLFKDYTNNLSEIAKDTVFLDRMRHVCQILGFLSQKYYNMDDLIEISRNMINVQETKLGLFLFEAYSLLQSYANMISRGIEDIRVLNIIGNKIGTILIGHEEKKMAERDIAQLKALSEYEWFLKFPLHIIREYENFDWFAYDCPADLKHLACSMFYSDVLESLLRVIVEFNAKVVWREKWRDELSQVVKNRDFDRYLLSDLLNIIGKLEAKSSYLSNVSGILPLLRKNLEMRNSLVHGKKIKIDFDRFTGEIKEILYGLRFCTPTVFQVLEKRGNGYRTRILWGHFPRHIQLITQQELRVNGFYYSTPFVVIEGTRVLKDPSILVSAYEVHQKYAKEKKVVSIKTPEYSEDFYVRTVEPTRIVLVRELAKEVYSKLEKIELGGIKRDQLEELIEKPEMRMKFREVLANPKRMKNFLFDVYHVSFIRAGQKEKKNFEMQSKCFERCLKLLEMYFGPRARMEMVEEHNRTITAMFRNIVIGKGAGFFIKANSKEELVRMLKDFQNRYSRMDIEAPSAKKVIAELRRYQDIHPNEKTTGTIKKFLDS